MFIEDIKIGDTLYYNTYGMKCAKVSKICKVIDIQEDKPIILVKGSQLSYPAFPSKLSTIPQYRVVNIKTDQIPEYINTDITEDVKANNNYYKSYEERLNRHYTRAQKLDARNGW